MSRREEKIDKNGCFSPGVPHTILFFVSLRISTRQIRLLVFLSKISPPTHVLTASGLDQAQALTLSSCLSPETCHVPRPGQSLWRKDRKNGDNWEWGGGGRP